MIPSILALLVAISPSDTGKKVSFTGDASVVNTSGNSDITTVSVDDKLGIKCGKWLFAQTFSTTYARTSDTVSASQWHASVRGDRSLSARDALFLLTEYDRDVFSGVSSRLTPSIGVSGKLIDDSTTKFRIDAGVGYTWQRGVVDDSTRAFATGRVALVYHRQLSAKSSVDESLELLPSFNDAADMRINSETSITAPITTGIALKASYVIHFVGVPEPGFRKTDRILTTGVQITL